MVNSSLDYCIFQDGICQKCGFKIENYDPTVPTTRFCKQVINRANIRHFDLLYDRHGRPVNMKDLYSGASIFYIGAGPSLNTMDLSLLDQRHITTFAVNNVAAKHVRPNIWMCCDNPQSFHPIIWKDPSILKIISAQNSRVYIRDVLGDGVVKSTSNTWAIECPGTLCVNVTSEFSTRDYFDTPSASWGREKGSQDDLGVSGSRSTMLAAFKVLTWLGFKNIYLLGCDFHMPMAHPYAFEQGKGMKGCQSNNESYEKLNTRLTALAPMFKQRGVNIYNCTPDSKLTAFPRMAYQKAINRCKYPHKPELNDWYL